MVNETMHLPRRGTSPMAVAFVVVALGALGIVLQALHDPTRALYAFLAAYGFGVGTALGALVLAMALIASGARWPLVLMPRILAVASTLPVFALLFVPIGLGLRHLYPWAHDTTALDVSVQAAIAHQRTWNNPTFFLARTLAYLASWCFLVLLLTRAHVENDGFILLDGDVVFDLGVVEELVERGPDCLAVRSVGEIGLEEVKVTADNEDRVLAIGKHVPVRSAMGESVGIELFSAATSRRLFAALHQRVRELGLVNEYYEAAFQQIIDTGVPLYGVDIGSMYATEIDTVEDLAAANARLAQRPAFDVRVDGLRLAV